MNIDVITKSKDLADLKETWISLYEKDPEAHYFLSWAFLSTYFLRYEGSWFILAARPGSPGSAYVALLPLRLRTKMNEKTGSFHNEINMGGSYAADYTGVICKPEFADRAVAAFAKHLRKMPWAKLHLENLRMSGRRMRCFLDSLQDKKLVVQKLSRFNERDKVDNCICPAIELPQTWERYLEQSLSTNTRQRMRRFLRKVEQSDDFRITHADASTIRRDVELLLQFWRIKWAERKGDLLPGLLKSNRLLFTHAFENGTLFLPVLWHKDRPLGALAFFVDPIRKTMLFYMAGRDETADVVPPGLVLHGHSIRLAIEQGFQTYDFLRGNEPYKYSFGTKDTAIKCLLVQTATGRNLGERLDPRCLGSVFKQASRFHKDGRMAQAENAYRQILDTDPGYARALYGLGQLLAEKGDHREAAKTFRTLSAIAPDSARVWHRLGIALQALGDHAAAVVALNRACEQKPGFAAAQYSLARSLLQLKHPVEAVNILATILRQRAKGQGDDVYCNKARVLLLEMKNYKRRRTALRPVENSGANLDARRLDIRTSVWWPGSSQPRISEREQEMS
jgi:tetratricopeptide (TPR) repeat protein